MKAVNRAVIYVARDIERALGQTPSADYIILTGSTPYAEEIRAKYPDFVFTFKSEAEDKDQPDTYDLLVNKSVIEKIVNTAKNFKEVGILVFKNNSRIEKAVREISDSAHVLKNESKNISIGEIKLLNPDAKLADKIEGKITQVEWLKKEASLINLLPPNTVCKAKEIKWGMKIGNETGNEGAKQSFVVQWNHGHTGTGTVFIEKEADVSKYIEATMAERDARVTKKINGVMYTTNGIVFKRQKSDSDVNNSNVIVCHTSLQITGMLPFTDSVSTTVGNDWALPHDFLSEKVQEKINEICRSVGEKMAQDGWLGLYGIDVIVEDGTEEVFLIEINARQSANISYESILQDHFKNQGAQGITTFNAHINALFGDEAYPPNSTERNKGGYLIIPINDGAQIIQRNTEKFIKAKNAGRQIDLVALRNLGFNVIEYTNTEISSDALRIQSTKGIMERSHTFNARGKEILGAVSEIYPL